VDQRSKNGYAHGSSDSPDDCHDSSVDNPRDNGSPCGTSTDHEVSADVAAPQKRCASSADSLRDVQVPRLTSTGGHPCARDYDDVTKEYIVAACTLFCVKISALQGFPDLSQELLMVHEVWPKVGEQLNCSLHLAACIAKLVRIWSHHY
jgi:hypothetical protein